jgi:chromosome segregation ATPase
MTNENKKINELVSDDDDPTAELEIATFRQSELIQNAMLEVDTNTQDFPRSGAAKVGDTSIAELKSDLKTRSDTIERLQFDIEQLHARWVGLEAEIKAREEITSNLGAELRASNRKLDRKEKLLAKRDRNIKSLKAEIRERDQAYRDIEKDNQALQAIREELEAGEEVTVARRQLDVQAGQLAHNADELANLKAQQQRTEQYADELRRQINDIRNTTEDASKERDSLAARLDTARQQADELEIELKQSRDTVTSLTARTENMEVAHAEEIRLLRFELGEAESTLAENEHISEQIASDLVDTRTFRDELEHMLTETTEKSGAKIEELQKRVKQLENTLAEQEENLGSKNDTINTLLSELAKKSHEIESIGEMEDVIHEIDDRMSERIEELPRTDRERVTRLLIGRVEDRELRFPLFKERLTIGRTQQNDIQLKAQYISRRHAVITTEGDKARLIDWGSKNGVYVNSKRIKEHFLKNGDIVSIGVAEFRYEELAKRDS